MTVYLHLFHGRERPDQDMTSWGCDGPKIGPLACVQTTYGGDVKLRGAQDVLEKFFPNTEIHFHDGFGEHAIQLDGDCLPYGGKVYDDWSVCTADAFASHDTPPVRPVCDVCGSDDLVKDAASVWDPVAQRWSLLSTYDSTTCQACEREGDDMCVWQPLAGDRAPVIHPDPGTPVTA